MNALKIMKAIVTLAVLIFVILGPVIFEEYKEHCKEITEEKEDKWQGIIVLWDYPSFNKENGTRYEWITNKIKQFEKENRGVFIDFKPVNPDNFLVEIETASKTNSLPDIAPIGCERDIQQSGLLEPLNDFIPEDTRRRYINGVINSATYRGSIYGIPRLVDLHIIALNRYELENCSADVPQEIDWNVKEFLDVSEILYQNTGTPFIANEKTIYNIIQCILDRQEFIDLKKINGFRKNNNILSQFKSGNFSAVACSTMDLSKVEYSLGNIAEMRLITLYNESDGHGLAGNCIAYGVFKQKDKKKLEICLKLIQHLTDSSEQMDLWKYNAFSVLSDISPLYSEDSDMGKLENLLDNSNKSFINNLEHQDRVDLMNKYEH